MDMNMEIKRILFATDFSDTSKKAMALTLKMKNAFNAHVDVLHVFDQEAFEVPLPYGMMPGGALWSVEHIDEARDTSKKSIEAIRAELGECDGHFVEGAAGEEIVRFAHENNIDMIIMGTHGYRGFRRILMGSVVEYVLRHTDKAILTVKGEPNEE